MAHDFAGIGGWEIRARYAIRIFLKWVGKVTVREREFVKQCILQIKKGNNFLPLRIMDVGSASSYVPLELAKQGNEVVAVDIRPYPLRHQNLTFIQGDITAADFGLGMPPFDVITCISTLEHIGVGHYGDKSTIQGDRLAIATMYRLLKPEGSLLITIPFGGEFSQDDFQRVYDFPHIQGLFVQGWRLREERFHIPQGKKNWVIATRDQVRQRYPAYPESNHACFWWVKEEIPLDQEKNPSYFRHPARGH